MIGKTAADSSWHVRWCHDHTTPVLWFDVMASTAQKKKGRFCRGNNARTRYFMFCWCFWHLQFSESIQKKRDLRTHCMLVDTTARLIENTSRDSCLSRDRAGWKNPPDTMKTHDTLQASDGELLSAQPRGGSWVAPSSWYVAAEPTSTSPFSPAG